MDVADAVRLGEVAGDAVRAGVALGVAFGVSGDEVPGLGVGVAVRLGVAEAERAAVGVGVDVTSEAVVEGVELRPVLWFVGLPL